MIRECINLGSRSGIFSGIRRKPQGDPASLGAAEMLGINRNTLRKKLQQHGLL
jgi:Factor for inversion stimulation Fis, transcriptional activator